MAQRLPVPGSDNNKWGIILNGFLRVSHNSDGTLSKNAVKAAGGVVTNEIGSANGVASLDNSGTVPIAQLGSGMPSSSNFLRGDGVWAVPSATASPSSSSSASATTTIDTETSDIQALGKQAAGSTNKAADAGHVHPMPSLDQILAPSASISLAGNKITNLAAGTASSDAATFSQIPIAGTGSTNYTAGNAIVGGDLAGNLPNPTVAKLDGVAVSGSPSTNQVLVATGPTAASWQTLASANSPLTQGAKGDVANSTTGTYSGGANGTLRDTHWGGSLPTPTVGQWISAPAATISHALIGQITAVSGVTPNIQVTVSGGSSTTPSSSSNLSYSYGTDDTTALQAWLNGGGSLIGLGRTYFCSTTLSLSTPADIDLQGGTIRLIGSQTATAIPNLLVLNASMHICNGANNQGLDQNIGAWAAATSGDYVVATSSIASLCEFTNAGVVNAWGGITAASSSALRLTNASLDRGSSWSTNGPNATNSYGIAANDRLTIINCSCKNFSGYLVSSASSTQPTTIYGLDCTSTTFGGPTAVSVAGPDSLLSGIDLSNTVGTYSSGTLQGLYVGGSDTRIVAPNLSNFTSTGQSIQAGISVAFASNVKIIGADCSGVGHNVSNYHQAAFFLNCTNIEVLGGTFTTNNTDGCLIANGCTDGRLAPAYVSAAAGYECISVSASNRISIAPGDVTMGVGMLAGVVVKGGSKDCEVTGGHVSMVASCTGGVALYDGGTARTTVKNVTIDNPTSGSLVGLYTDGNPTNTQWQANPFTSSGGGSVTIADPVASSIFMNQPISVGGAMLSSVQQKTVAANEVSGSTSANLGAASPATVTTPYKWELFTASDGTQCYFPVWK